MLDLEERGRDVRRFVHSLEGWIIATLADLGSPLIAPRAASGSGWAKARERKIAALGIRVKRWVTLHGIARSTSSPDLAHFGGIVPCGISEFGVTSLSDLVSGVEMLMLR